MHLWQDDWLTAVTLYAVFTLAVLPEGPTLFGPVLFAGMMWAGATLSIVADIARRKAAGLGTPLVILQTGTIGMAVLAFLGRLGPGTHWLPAAAALAAAAGVLAVLSERSRTTPSPRTSLESTLVVIFCAAYLLAMRSPKLDDRVVALLAVHLGVLSVAVLRNSHIRSRRVEGPVASDGHIREVWQLELREPRGIPAVAAALCLPTGILGTSLVVAELGIYIALGRF
jgi:hypothetical protein